MYCDGLKNQCESKTKKWSEELNTEWVIRNYLAIKMILSSSVMLRSLEYAIEKKLRIVEPFLLYNALLQTCRSLILTLPKQKWDSGKMILLDDKEVINIAVDTVSMVNADEGNKIKRLLIKAKGYREFFSYIFPAKGIESLDTDFVVTLEEIIPVCSLLCEIAQLNSEILSASIETNLEDEFGLMDDMLVKSIQYESENYSFIDEEDYYRISYIYKKSHRPFNLLWTMTLGKVEDFFSVWYPEFEKNSSYIPDEAWQIIFPVPY